jgi:peptidoglycan/xylan/chitin deacetylase (PgdA/CDA1 family)
MRHNKVVSWLYHEVTDLPAESGFQNPAAWRYKISISQFTSDLSAILASDSMVRTVYDLDEMTHPGPHPTLLTFDDGGASGLTVADILEANGVKGHFLITTAKIGSPGFLNEKSIRALHERGHVIGSHSHSHRTPFSRLNVDELLNEWNLSSTILNEIIGQHIVAGSVPGGSFNDRVLIAASQAGLRHIFTSVPTYRIVTVNGARVYGRLCPNQSTPRLLKQLGLRRWPIWPLTQAWNLRTALWNIKNRVQLATPVPTW